jgi:hypothetical protein
MLKGGFPLVLHIYVLKNTTIFIGCQFLDERRNLEIGDRLLAQSLKLKVQSQNL